MVTVKTYAELEAAVLCDEPQIRLEENAKQYYERKVGDLVSGGVIGALPGLLVAGPLGAVIGAAAGAIIGNSVNSGEQERDIAKFLARYYRKTTSGVTFIELQHR